MRGWLSRFSGVLFSFIVVLNVGVAALLAVQEQGQAVERSVRRFPPAGMPLPASGTLHRRPDAPARIAFLLVPVSHQRATILQKAGD